MRERAIERINKDQYARRRSLTGSTSARTASDSFHDGQEVLPDVTSWHGVLRSALRETDTITSRVLDVVDKKMLLGESRKRSKAKDICKELKQILCENQARPRKPIPESIMQALLEVDEAAASSEAAGLMSSKSTTGMGKSLTVPQDRKARKSKLLDLPLMKTTHRSEYLKSALSAQGVEQDIKHSIHESPTKEVLPVEPPKQPDSVPASFSLPLSPLPQHYDDRNHAGDVYGPRTGEGGHVPSTTSISSTPVHLSLPRRSSTNTPQNVFQAREEVERREKGNLLRRVRKDELLTRHFGDRDIVSSSAQPRAARRVLFTDNLAEISRRQWGDDESTLVRGNLSSRNSRVESCRPRQEWYGFVVYGWTRESREQKRQIGFRQGNERSQSSTCAQNAY